MHFKNYDSKKNIFFLIFDKYQLLLILSKQKTKIIKSNLNIPFLMDIHSKYCDSMEQILTLISSPLILMTFAMTKVKENHLSIENAVKLGFFINNPPKDPKDAATHLVNFFKESLEKANENIFEDALKESSLLYDKSQEIRDCFNNIGLNALVNSWTLFETYSKHIWIKCLNENPQFLNNKIINTKVDNDNNQTSKSIPLNLLSKYNYNVSNHLGEILSNKYDFTGVDGIKKAFKDLLNLEDIELRFLDDNNIIQLEVCRHIIVHNASTIDSRYLTRSKKKNEIINHKLVLEVQEINDMINSSIKCIKETLLITQEKINNR